MSTAADEPEQEPLDFKHEPGTPGKDDVDERLCLEVEASYRKVMETERVTISWMTGELANRLHAALHAAFQSLQMEMMRGGLEPKAAEALAQQQLGLMYFELGRRVGLDQAGANMLRDMLGDDFGSGLD